MGAGQRRRAPRTGRHQEGVVEDLVATVGEDPLRAAPDLGDALGPVADVMDGAEPLEVERLRVAAERLRDRQRLQPEVAARREQLDRRRLRFESADREHRLQRRDSTARDHHLEPIVFHDADPVGKAAPLLP